MPAVAAAVAAFEVVYLRSGERVPRTSDGMGGGFGDDLGARCSELRPEVLGFDEGHVYWRDASGHSTRKGWDLRSHETQVVEDADEALDHWGLVPWDPQRGRQVGDLATGQIGFLAPDEQFRVDEQGYAGKVTVTRASTGTPVPLEHRDRFPWFGGWSDGTTFFGLSRSHREDGYDPAAPDRTRGHLVSCSVSSGTCEKLADLTATRSVAFPGQGEKL